MGNGSNASMAFPLAPPSGLFYIEKHPFYHAVFCFLFFLFFLGEVISNLRDLQSLSVDTSAEKEKQKAEVKHILQQKQRALSDLFKMLAEIGEYLLSHLK